MAHLAADGPSSSAPMATQPNGITTKTIPAASIVSDSQATVLPKSKEAPKYKHVSAVHSFSKVSCLTAGVAPTPSFAGFINLMLLVIRVFLNNRNQYELS